MAPHYDRFADTSAEQNEELILPSRSGIDDDALEGAAEALREVEVEAAQPDVPEASTLTQSQIEQMNIDELREIAKELDIPDRATITEKDELIEAIRRCL